MNNKQVLTQLVEKRKDELLALVSDLIQIPSENPTGSQHGVIGYIKEYLNAAGIEHSEVSANNEFPCLLASVGNEEGFHLLFNGHVDVVPAGDRSQWDFDPFCGTVTETQILGRGTSDMKSGVAAFLFTAKLLKECAVPLKGKVRLHIVSDEESGGQFGTQWLCENGFAEGVDACIVAEPTSKTIEIGQKGKVVVFIRAKGKSAHGSLGGFKGDNAIMKMTEVLSRLTKLTQISGKYSPDQAQALADSKDIAEKEIGVPGVGEVIDHASVNVGVIKGGTRANMVPDQCEATIDIRLPIGVKREEIERAVLECVEGIEGISCEFSWQGFGNYTSDQDPLVLSVRKNAETLWKKNIIPAYQWASSDAREYRKLKIPTLQYGPSNTEGIHSYNENVDIDDVVKSAQIYIMTICDLLGVE